MLKGTLRVLAGAAAAGMITSSASAVVFTEHIIDFEADAKGVLSAGGLVVGGGLPDGKSLSEREKVSGTQTGHAVFSDTIPGIQPSVVGGPAAVINGTGALAVPTDEDGSGLKITFDELISNFMADVRNMRTGLVNENDPLRVTASGGQLPGPVGRR